MNNIFNELEHPVLNFGTESWFRDQSIIRKQRAPLTSSRKFWLLLLTFTLFTGGIEFAHALGEPPLGSPSGPSSTGPSDDEKALLECIDSECPRKEFVDGKYVCREFSLDFNDVMKELGISCNPIAYWCDFFGISTVGHVLNACEMSGAAPGTRRFCIIEPQAFMNKEVCELPDLSIDQRIDYGTIFCADVPWDPAKDQNGLIDLYKKLIWSLGGAEEIKKASPIEGCKGSFSGLTVTTLPGKDGSSTPIR